VQQPELLREPKGGKQNMILVELLVLAKAVKELEEFGELSPQTRDELDELIRTLENELRAEIEL